MAASAFQTQYRREFIAGFEQAQSLLSATVTTEAVFSGSQATFLVADTGGATAVTRGVNGFIPARPDNLTQNTITLTEWHDLPRRTKFNIFASQGDGRRILQEGTRKVINRQIDQSIIAALNTATVNTGAAAVASLALVVQALDKLTEADVPVEDMNDLFLLVTPRFWGRLLQINSFTSADWVDVKPLVGPARKMKNWAGFNILVHPHLPGVGTNAEKCFAYTRSAIGMAVNTGEMEATAGYNEEQSYYWARASVFMGAGLLQNAGVVVVNHDGTSF